MAACYYGNTMAQNGSPTTESLDSLKTGRDVRLFARNHECPPTSGLAPTYLQANLIALPSRYASDFRVLCARNPVPCPLIAESAGAGAWGAVKSHLGSVLDGGAILGEGADIRRDIPRYNVYVDSALAKPDARDVVADWTDDHVAFLIGCSYSFETALADAGLAPLHAALGRNIAMYRTGVPLCPAGVFTGGTYVVSMRAYRAADVERVREITRPYVATHGEPLAWGWDAVRALGIADIDVPDWGDAPLARDGRKLGAYRGSDELVPVFWGCGVTPQEAVMRAGLQGVVMSHSPGYMLALDIRDSDILDKQS